MDFQAKNSEDANTAWYKKPFRFEDSEVDQKAQQQAQPKPQEQPIQQPVPEVDLLGGDEPQQKDGPIDLLQDSTPTDLMNPGQG